MDLPLRCNVLECRQQLTTSAIVTTCSHIFCERCSAQSGLTEARLQTRTCPACRTPLSAPDDAIRSSLNPSEDYKTSVLSGLSPSNIMECAGRAVSFFNYQAVQEILYQNAMAKQVSEKYSELNTQANAMVEGANKEISNLTARLEAAINDREELQKKNDELAAAFRGKGKSMAQLQQLYNKLKAQVNTGYIEEAAAQTVDDMIHGAAGAYMGQPPQRPPQVHTTVRSPGMFMNQRQTGGGSGGIGARPYFGGAKNIARGSDGNATPVQHRERLGVSPHTRNVSAHGQSGVSLGHNILQPTPARVSLRSIDPNLTGGIASGSQGMSAGAKMGRQTSGYPGGRNAATGTRSMGPPFLRM